MFVRKRKVPHSQRVRQIGDPVRPTKFRNQVLVVSSLPKEMVVREYMGGNIKSIYHASVTISMGSTPRAHYIDKRGKGHLIKVEKIPGLKNAWKNIR